LNIQHCFNKASATYDDSCHLQKITGKHLLDLIIQLNCCFSNTIDLGCGTGIVTKNFISTLQSQQFHAIDSARELLAIAKQRLPNITVYEADFQMPIPSPLLFDLAYSNLALHWGNNLNNIFGNIAKILKPSATLAFTIPLNGTFNELDPRIARQHFHTQQYIQQLLQSNGFETVSCDIETLAQSFTDYIAALKSIKRVGANYAAPQHKGLRGKNYFRQLNLRSLTYRVGYFIAKLRATP